VQNPPLLLIKNHFIFNLEMVEDTSSSSATASRPVDETTVPAQQQQLLANVRNTHATYDYEEDDMTGFTSRMDDDPVREVFEFLDKAHNAIEEEDDDDDDDEDKIVYMRYVPS
jgi:hypothetical protein